jgi:hypothetical protein
MMGQIPLIYITDHLDKTLFKETQAGNYMFWWAGGREGGRKGGREGGRKGKSAYRGIRKDGWERRLLQLCFQE